MYVLHMQLKLCHNDGDCLDTQEFYAPKYGSHFLKDESFFL